MHTGHTGAHPECPAQVAGEAEPLGPTGLLLHKAILPIPGDRAALPNTWKQTQGSSQNVETKKHVTMKGQKKFPEKDLNEMEAGKVLDTRFKTRL